MAMDFIDSMSHSGFGGSQIPVSRKWTGFTNASYVNTPVRRSGQVVIAVTGSISKTLSYKANRYLGFAYQVPNGSSTANLCNFGSGGVNLCSLNMQADNTLSIDLNGGSGQIYNSGAQGLIFTFDMYHYVELQCVLSGGSPISCTCTLYVDGQLWASAVSGATGVNASSLLANSTFMNQITIGAANGGINTAWVCDLYCLNSDTTDVNSHATTLHTFLGDVAVDALVPVADVSVAWSPFPSGTSPTFPLIAEIPPDDDTTYIFSDTIGQVATYNFQPLSGFIGTIFGAQLLLYAKKDAEGTRSIAGLVGGTVVKDTYGNTPSYLDDYYDYYIYPLDSDNGTAWTPAIYNAENFGVDLSS
jgi:hypothetical protein